MILKPLTHKIVIFSMLLSLAIPSSWAVPPLPFDSEERSTHISTPQTIPQPVDKPEESKKILSTSTKVVLGVGGALALGVGLWWYYSGENNPIQNIQTPCYSANDICPETIDSRIFAFLKSNGKIIASKQQECIASFYDYYRRCGSVSDKEPADLGFIDPHFLGKNVSILLDESGKKVVTHVRIANGDCLSDLGGCSYDRWIINIQNSFFEGTRSICNYFASYHEYPSTTATEDVPCLISRIGRLTLSLTPQ